MKMYPDFVTVILFNFNISCTKIQYKTNGFYYILFIRNRMDFERPKVVKTNIIFPKRKKGEENEDYKL